MTAWPRDTSRAAPRTLSETSPLYKWVTGPEDPGRAARRTLEESLALVEEARRLVARSRASQAEARGFIDKLRGGGVP